ncbi:histone-like nucleoid-structuring protein Lsr2 [Actinoallomurus sp. NPDC052274]|uniref:Lsr2 family DNA-binding protein n=1 Tax=Actinoallomurus sp. NPDC052274 TaxID=3155420 RepID=UPI0034327257
MNRTRQVLQDLRAGKTVEECAQESGFSRATIIGLINGQPGLYYNEATDKLSSHPGASLSNTDRPDDPGEPSEPEAKPDPDEEPDPDPSDPPHDAKQEEFDETLLDGLKEVFAGARQIDSAQIRRSLTKAATEISKLRQLYDAWIAKETAAREAERRRQEAEAKVRRLQEQLAAAQAELRDAGGSGTGKRGHSAISGASASTIRAWAKTRGIEVNERGRIPEAVVEQYELEHAGAQA